MSTNSATIDWPHHLDQHRPWILDLARSRLGDSHEAEDVAQEICLSILSSEPSVEDPAKIRGWLYRVVIRRVADHMRCKYRRDKFEEAYSDECQAQTDFSAEGWDWLLASEQRVLLKRALSKLPPTERQLIVLRFVHDQSYETLAKRFDASKRSIEYQLVRAKQRLRKMMQQELGEYHD